MKNKIYIKVKKSIRIGDKITGRHGNKGVISLILPDDKMPYFELNGDKKVLDLIFNPNSVISRMNLGQILETHLGFVIKRLKDLKRENEAEIWMSWAKPFKDLDLKALSEVTGKDYKDKWEALSQTLEELGLDKTGKAEVYVYNEREKKFQKLLKPVTVGYQYILKLVHTADEKVSAREAPTGRRAISTRQPIRGRKKEGGQRCGEMEAWALISHGALNTLRELYFFSSDAKRDQAETSSDWIEFGTKKALLDFLKACFIDFKIDEENEQVSVDYLSPDKFRQEEPYKIEEYNDLIVSLNNGERLEKFGYIDLNKERVFHPWFIDLIEGEGSDIIKALLKGDKVLIKGNDRWDVREMPEKEERINLYKNKKIKIGYDAVNYLLNNKNNFEGYLDDLLITLNNNKMVLSTYTFDILPVLPYKYRIWCYPIYWLYNKKERREYKPLIGEYIDILRFLKGITKKKDDEDKVSLRTRFLKKIYSYFERMKREIFSRDGIIRDKILGKRIDRSGRAVIVPDPQLPVDEILIPSYVHKKIFREIKEPNKYLVLLNRQPTLHKYSIFSFRHRVSNDNCIHISPLICKPYNADFDGDTMAIYLPTISSSQEELKKMLFTNHLYSSASGEKEQHKKLQLHISQDIKLGLYYILETKDEDETEEERFFKEDIKKRIADLIGTLPTELKTVENLFEKLVEKGGKELSASLSELARIAFESATYSGTTFSIFDLIEIKDNINLPVANFIKKEEWDSSIMKTFKTKIKEPPLLRNPIIMLVNSGARGNPEQLIQLVYKRRFPSRLERPIGSSKSSENVGDVKEEDFVLFSSLLEGHANLEYFLLSYITRDSLMDKKLNVAHAGYLTRLLVESSYNLRVKEKDCGLNREELTRSFILDCKSQDGLCVECLLKAGIDVDIGDFIGIQSATFIGERGTQLTMQTFHKGSEKQELSLDELKRKLTNRVDGLEKWDDAINNDAYKKIKKELFHIIYKARMSGKGCLSVVEKINEFDLLHRMSFERGRDHLVKAIKEGKNVDKITSAKSKLFFLGRLPYF